MDKIIESDLFGMTMQFITNEKMFSPSAVDKGTLAMLSLAEFKDNDKVLDLGCGYGVVGIYASCFLQPENILLSDIEDEAVRLSTANLVLNQKNGISVLKSDGFQNIPDRDFTMILCNPPYHEDFSIAKQLIEESYKRLLDGGRILLVTKRLKWYQNKLTAVFGGTMVKEADGYYVFQSIKKPGYKRIKEDKKGRMSKKLYRKNKKIH